MRSFISTMSLAALCLAGSALFAGCGGGGGGVPVAGRIAGSITIGGPVNSSAEVAVGLFQAADNQLVASFEAGRITSEAVATGSVNGREITYDFSGLELGSYYTGIYSGEAAAPQIIWQGDPVVVNDGSPESTGRQDTASMLGNGPYGTISGVVDVAGDWPADGSLVFLGFDLNGSGNPAAYYVFEGMPSDGTAGFDGSKLIYNMDFLPYGSYTVGLYQYNPQTHAFMPLGERDVAIEVGADDPNVTNVNFPANFAGDPGEDPTLGTITGTVNFSGALPSGPKYYVAANTIPPQMGAPLSSLELPPEDVGAGGPFGYQLDGLPDGEYTVSVFAYNFQTHQATYFGDYDGTVIIDEQAQLVAGIDFDADVSILE